MRARTIVLLLALVAGLGLLAAPAVQAKPAQSHAQAQMAAFAARMEAQGWTTAVPTFADLPDAVQANISAGVPQPFQVFCETVGYWSGNKKWYRESTGRWYYMWGNASVCVNANTWRPELQIWSKRSYGNLTVDGYFTLYWDHFRALSFAGSLSEPSTIEGERNPVDVSCTNNVQSLQGVDRTRVVTRTWVMSFIGYVAMDFRQPDCSFVHQTNIYSLGSYRVGDESTTYATAWDTARSGWI